MLRYKAVPGSAHVRWWHEVRLAFVPGMYRMDRLIGRAHVGLTRSNPMNRGKQLHSIWRLKAVDQTGHALDMLSHRCVSAFGDKPVSFRKCILDRLDFRFHNAIAKTTDEMTLHANSARGATGRSRGRTDA